VRSIFRDTPQRFLQRHATPPSLWSDERSDGARCGDPER
jgi:hypothetical protein